MSTKAPEEMCECGKPKSDHRPFFMADKRRRKRAPRQAEETRRSR